MQGQAGPLPRTGVSVIVFGPQGVLLVKRAKVPYAGYWSLPGGSQEFGETLEAAARRELREETGLVAQSLTFAEIIEPMARDETGTLVAHFVLAIFSCNGFDGEAVAGDDAAAVQWTPLADLRNLRMTPGTADLVRALVNGE